MVGVVNCGRLVFAHNLLKFLKTRARDVVEALEVAKQFAGGFCADGVNVLEHAGNFLALIAVESDCKTVALVAHALQ